MHPMRILVALMFLAVGGLAAAHAALPPRWSGWLDALPPALVGWLQPAGAGLAAVGLGMLLIRPRRTGALLSDAPLIGMLEHAGFSVLRSVRGWQASGMWRGTPLVVRLGPGYEATRFGRPWTVVVSLPGRPAEPWPLLPEEGLLLDVRPEGFSVAMADLSRPERQHLFSSRLDQLVAQRH
jgi:hypothetical protein